MNKSKAHRFSELLDGFDTSLLVTNDLERFPITSAGIPP